jgi:hypothetical protein
MAVLWFHTSQARVLYFLQDRKEAKWPNHIISRKLIRKRPNGNPDENKS